MNYSLRPAPGRQAGDSAVFDPEEPLKTANFLRLRQSIRAAAGGSSRQQLAPPLAPTGVRGR